MLEYRSYYGRRQPVGAGLPVGLSPAVPLRVVSELIELTRSPTLTLVQEEESGLDRESAHWWPPEDRGVGIPSFGHLTALRWLPWHLGDRSPSEINSGGSRSSSARHSTRKVQLTLISGHNTRRGRPRGGIGLLGNDVHDPTHRLGAIECGERSFYALEARPDGGKVRTSLTPRPIRLDALVVTSGRRLEPLSDVAVSTEVVSRREIEDIGAPDLAALLTSRANRQSKDERSNTHGSLTHIEMRIILNYGPRNPSIWDLECQGRTKALA